MPIEEDKFVKINSRFEGEQTAPLPPENNPFPEPIPDGRLVLSEMPLTINGGFLILRRN